MDLADRVVGSALGLALGLYLDLAVSVDRAGSDAWAWQDVYALDASVGAPPDDFNLKGQDWGLPPLRPDRLRGTRYELYVAALREAMTHAGALRIDHVMGLMRLFWIPRGASAASGAYVHYELEEMLAILALESHRKAVAAMEACHFKAETVPVEVPGKKGATVVEKDEGPRKDTTLEALAALKPSFEKNGTVTAGNAPGITDGAAAVWVANEAGLARLPAGAPRARLVDYELAAVDIFHEGLLMAPAYAIPRLLARHGLALDAIDLWEIHEAVAAQVLCNVAALESEDFLREQVRVDARLGRFPWERFNPNGGSISIE